MMINRLSITCYTDGSFSDFTKSALILNIEGKHISFLNETWSKDGDEAMKGAPLCHVIQITDTMVVTYFHDLCHKKAFDDK